MGNITTEKLESLLGKGVGAPIGNTKIPDDGYDITLPSEKKIDDEVKFIDNDWVSNGFMIRAKDLSNVYQRKRFTTNVSSKVVDTSMGGNISINVSPQFTRYCDVRNPGLLSSNRRVKVNEMNVNVGMGNYYGTAIDDNSTNVYMELGFAKFNNVLYYLFSSVDYKTAVIANSGRSPLAYNVGKFTGIAALMIAFPVVTVAVLALKMTIGFANNMLSSPGRFDHYYLNPEMFLYWSTVNTIATMMFTELGVLSPMFIDDKKDSKRVGAPLSITSTDLAAIKKIMPGIITSQNGINIHAMITRGQKRINQHRANRLSLLSAIENKTLTEADGEKYLYTVKDLQVDDVTADSDDNNLWTRLSKNLKKDKTYDSGTKPKDLKDLLTDAAAATAESISKAFATDDDGTYNRELREEDSKSWLDNYTETMQSVFNEGARYAVFRVDHVGSTTTSFSNTTTTVGLDEKVNNMGKTFRDMKFNLGGGEIPILSDIMRSVTDVVVGATDGLTLGFTNVVAGFIAGSTLEVNKRWDGSTASLPNHTFKMPLRSPSAHPVAQLQNLYIPLSAVLATVLPKSTGPKSYTSPFLCNAFVRGLERIDKGMVTSVTITAGSSNLPYNKARRPLAFDVTFTVTDFASVISAPTPTDLLSSGSVLYDDEGGLSRYIQTLCGRDLFSTTHVFDKAKIKFSRFLQDHDLMYTSEFLGAKTGDMASSGGMFSVLSAMSDHKQINYSELY